METVWFFTQLPILLPKEKPLPGQSADVLIPDLSGASAGKYTAFELIAIYMRVGRLKQA